MNVLVVVINDHVAALDVTDVAVGDVKAKVRQVIDCHGDGLDATDSPARWAVTSRVEPFGEWGAGDIVDALNGADDPDGLPVSALHRGDGAGE